MKYDFYQSLGKPKTDEPLKFNLDDFCLFLDMKLENGKTVFEHLPNYAPEQDEKSVVLIAPNGVAFFINEAKKDVTNPSLGGVMSEKNN